MTEKTAGTGAKKRLVALTGAGMSAESGFKTGSWIPLCRL